MSIDKFEMVVGLEVHVQLKTASKAFCSCSADFGAPPNTNTCPVCLALPGALPVLNKRAVELAARAAIGLGCKVHPVSVFSRKNYFYPDLPKGYQISQFDQPLATEGCLTIGESAEGKPLRVRITRVHMEEDAGKSIHDRYPGATAIDLNRAGVPLIEIVSEPDMRSAAEAGAYLRSLKQILQYLGVSDVSMEEGSLRVDANVSARPHGVKTLGTKTEVKNMNSFSAVERALQLEFERQCGVLAAGGTVEQQTLLWDGANGTVRPSRTKEGSHDYRYFPEPDLRPLVLDKEWIAKTKHDLPELPETRRARFCKDFALTSAEAAQVTSSPQLSEYFENVARASGDPRASLNWVIGEVQAAINDKRASFATLPVRPDGLGELISLIKQGTISHTAGKTVFAKMLETGKPAAQIAADEGLVQVNDDSSIEAWVDEVLKEHPDEAKRFLAGERKLQGVLVGFVMKKSKGRADPKRVNQLLASRAG